MRDLTEYRRFQQWESAVNHRLVHCRPHVFDLVSAHHAGPLRESYCRDSGCDPVPAYGSSGRVCCGSYWVPRPRATQSHLAQPRPGHAGWWSPAHGWKKSPACQCLCCLPKCPCVHRHGPARRALNEHDQDLRQLQHARPRKQPLAAPHGSLQPSLDGALPWRWSRQNLASWHPH